MPSGTLNYPFVAVSGMGDPKDALLCSMVNPRLRTILIRGKKGTGKTVLSRSLTDVSGKSIVNIPVNVSEEQLLGGLDIDVAIKDGRMVLEKGLLSKGDGNIVYVDNINLMDQSLAMTLIDSVRGGTVRLEREGISAEYDCDTTLVATMDPEESDISSHLLDRFDLCAYSDPTSEKDARKDVLSLNLEFGDDPRDFIESRSEESAKAKSVRSQTPWPGTNRFRQC